jgi:hypothetical protein
MIAVNLVMIKNLSSQNTAISTVYLYKNGILQTPIQTK